MSSLQKIKRLLTQFETQKTVSLPEQQYLMNIIRQVLESKKGYKRKYNKVNFYCNWTMHYQLDLSENCYQMLEEVQETLIKASESGFPDKESKERTDQFIGKASEFFSINILRNELVGLFSELNLPVFLFSGENWLNFVATLLYEIHDKPICYPADAYEEGKDKSKARKSYLNQYRKAHDSGLSPIKRFIVREVSIIEDEKTYSWCIRTEPKLTFRGELKVTRS